MSKERVFLSRKRADEFSDFWDYCDEVFEHAVSITENCESFDDLPQFNRMLVFSFCAATWNTDLREEVWREQSDDEYAEEERRERESVKAERAALKRKIRSLEKRLEKAKGKSKSAQAKGARHE